MRQPCARDDSRFGWAAVAWRMDLCQPALQKCGPDSLARSLARKARIATDAVSSLSVLLMVTSSGQSGGSAFGGADRRGGLSRHSSCHKLQQMNAERASWLRIWVGFLGVAAFSCSGRSDEPAAAAGSPSGGSINAASGSTASGSTAGGGTADSGGNGSVVDCGAVCARVKTLCPDNAAIDSVWLDACKSACNARVQLTPSVAQLERSCVMNATDCSASVVCVASPH